MYSGDTWHAGGANADDHWRSALDSISHQTVHDNLLTIQSYNRISNTLQEIITNINPDENPTNPDGRHNCHMTPITSSDL